MPVPHFEELEMEQGADWSITVNWYGGGVFRAPIEEIDSGYPTQIRVTAHQLPTVSDTPMIISGVEGADILNSRDVGVEEASRVDADYFTLPISTVSCNWVLGTGEITWYLPTDITNYTARCQLRSKWHSGVIIADLTTENGGITLNTNDASIQLNIPAAVTAGYSFVKAFLDCELIAPGEQVVRVFSGEVTLSREITR